MSIVTVVDQVYSVGLPEVEMMAFMVYRSMVVSDILICTAFNEFTAANHFVGSLFEPCIPNVALTSASRNCW